MILFLCNSAAGVATPEVVSNLFSGFIGAIVGALVTFLTTLLVKNNEIKGISLTNSKYIVSLLMKKRASLEQVNFIITKIKTEGLAQQVPIRELFLGIKQENLEKILTYKKFYKM